MVSCCTNWTYRTQGDFLHKLNCLNPRCILALHPRCLLAQIKLLEPKVSSCKNFNYMYERCLLLQVQQDESLASACTIVEQHAHMVSSCTTWITWTQGVLTHGVFSIRKLDILLHFELNEPMVSSCTSWTTWVHGILLYTLNKMNPWVSSCTSLVLILNFCYVCL